MSDIALSPGAAFLPRPQPYPERAGRRPDAVERGVIAAQSVMVARLATVRRLWLARIVAAVRRHDVRLRALDDAALQAEAANLRRALHEQALPGFANTAHAFALTREASARLLGLRHHDTQLIGGYAMIRGMIAEMETGEGKTLTATLAAVTMALAGHPVHVVTVNDYLVARDAEKLSPLYAFFGLTVGTVVQGMDIPTRRAAYACDVTYCTNKELAFDYLKDRVAMGQQRGELHLKLGQLAGGRGGGADDLILRGLHFAIVDEADSVLVDEARTPLILSRDVNAGAEAVVYAQAVEVAHALKSGTDYLLEIDERRMHLTSAGHAAIDAATSVFGGAWVSRVHREHLCVQALTALHLMNRDEQYLVRDGKVQIVDEYTGRIMPDRFWSDGLHQMVEIKEGCAVSGQRVTLARMTYQRFFRRYRHLAGMSGTAQEVAAELWRVYRLVVARIPTHRRSRRRVLNDRVSRRIAIKWQRITAETARLTARGVPVLIGTRSVASSQEMSQALAAAGIAHVVLNAAQDEAEAEIVAAAGGPGRVTVATNLAGRGTDIGLAAGVAQSGGLHVIMSERHDAGRIDRQLAGRCARQGDPGQFFAMLSLEDPLLADSGLRITRAIAILLSPLYGPSVGRWALRRAQRKAERLHARMRRDLLRNDEAIDHVLAFSGKSE